MCSLTPELHCAYPSARNLAQIAPFVTLTDVFDSTFCNAVASFPISSRSGERHSRVDLCSGAVQRREWAQPRSVSSEAVQMDVCFLWCWNEHGRVSAPCTPVYLYRQCTLSLEETIWTHEEQHDALVYSWLRFDIVPDVHIPLNYEKFKLTGLMWWQTDKSRGTFFFPAIGHLPLHFSDSWNTNISAALPYKVPIMLLS